jgi:hypothetical protein
MAQCDFEIISRDGPTYRLRCRECRTVRTSRTETYRRPCGVDRPPRPPGGPGTELKNLLRWLLIDPDQAGCQCAAHAAEMDRRGVAWCAENAATIVGWLRDEAARRGLPFADLAAARLVRLALWRARRRP